MPRTRAVATVSTTPQKRKKNDEPVEDIVSTQHKPDKIVTPSKVRGEGVRTAKRIRTEASTSSDKSLSATTQASSIPLEAPLKAAKGRVRAGSTSHKTTKSTTSRRNGKTTLVQAEQTLKDEPDELSDSKAILETEEAAAAHVNNQDVEKVKTCKKIVGKRMTKEEKAAAAMPLAARTTGLKMYVGAHVSIAKGVENAITNAHHIGANAFALFLKNQKRWESPSLKDENRDAFKQHCAHHSYDQASHALPHGSYLVNLASKDPSMSKKSYDTFVEDLHRCEALGIKYYNFHPGAANKEPLDEAIARLAGNLNRALAETKTVIPVLENMAGRGSVIGSRFSDLRDIIAAIKPEFKSRIGICIDTCHAFAAGYDLRSPEAYQKTFQELDQTVGLQYLKAMHLNDSKAPFNSNKDLHQNIGVGFLGLRAFHNVMNDSRLENIPMVLETPGVYNPYSREIKLLESLIGMDPEGEDFRRLEADLSDRGKAEREAMEKSIYTRDEKARKKAQRGLGKGQKNISAMLGAKGTKRAQSVSSSSSLSDVESDG